MKKTLLKKGLTKYLAGLIIIILLIFVPAGSLRYVNGWLFIGLLFIPMLIMGVVLFVKNPTLLEKRLNAKENEKEQKGVVAISGIMFLAGFVVAGLNYRFDWWMLPKWAVIAASVVFIASYIMYAEVLPKMPIFREQSRSRRNRRSSIRDFTALSVTLCILQLFLCFWRYRWF
jgi:hypothetical protein